MKIKETKQLKLKFDGDNANNFKEIIKKLAATPKQVGFGKQLFTDDEIKLIESLKSKIK